jgi:S-adenosylmethionine-diacylgycerolhomoserine-N-methlytransferase
MLAEARSHRVSMDRMYRVQRHIYDASRHFYLLGRDRLIAGLDVPEGGTVLEVGCGTGRNLVKVAKAYPTARVYGFDISDEMLKTAAHSIAKSGLTGRVRIAQGDALTFDCRATFGVEGFDRIFFSYTLSMIPRWRDAIAHVAGMLSAHGQLHAVDFGQCEDLGRLFKAMLFGWLRQFHVEPRGDLETAFRTLADRDGRQMGFAKGYRGYSWHASLGAPI